MQQRVRAEQFTGVPLQPTAGPAKLRASSAGQAMPRLGAHRRGGRAGQPSSSVPGSSRCGAAGHRGYRCA
ncbi:hypothetical protein WJX84_008120 [Apatococcus fuscideae]|uniref:Uncharacterized protein n=1 Tax=Apatococcus fuscideae TaxID=2026836 RepID=A0AAW1TBU1_9CHLO